MVAQVTTDRDGSLLGGDTGERLEQRGAAVEINAKHQFKRFGEQVQQITGELVCLNLGFHRYSLKQYIVY